MSVPNITLPTPDYSDPLAKEIKLNGFTLEATDDPHICVATANTPIFNYTYPVVNDKDHYLIAYNQDEVVNIAKAMPLSSCKVNQFIQEPDPEKPNTVPMDSLSATIEQSRIVQVYPDKPIWYIQSVLTMTYMGPPEANPLPDLINKPIHQINIVYTAKTKIPYPNLLISQISPPVQIVITINSPFMEV